MPVCQIGEVPVQTTLRDGARIFTSTFKFHAKYSPWFRFTLMDLALRVLFHRFQIIFDRIRLTFSVATGSKSTNEIKNTTVSTDNSPKPRRSCSWTYKINKLLVSPNECSNNIILERTIEYNATPPASKFHGKRIQRYLWDRERMERKTKVHMAHSRGHMFVTSYHMSQLQYQFTTHNMW